MGAGSSTNKSRVLTKIHVVSAISAKSNGSANESKDANRNESKHASDLIKKRSIHGLNQRILYNDTSSAWKVLGENSNHQVLCAKPSVMSTAPLSPFSGTSFEFEDEMDEVKEIHAYRGYRKISRNEDCSLCGAAGSYNGTWHGCRICDKLYHHLCLEQKGHLSDELEARALEESESEVGWSCPDCANIFDLLSESEKRNIIDLFDNMVGNDTSIDFKSYIRRKKESYSNLVGIQMPSPRETQEIGIFYDLDRDGSGSLEWWEFAPAMSLKFLRKRTQSELLGLLTAREVSKLESFFRMYDKNTDGKLTISEAKCAYLKWFLSLIKRENENDIPVAWTGELPPGWFGELTSDYIGVQTDPEITWQQFLSMNVLHVISARPNTMETRPYAPQVNDAIRARNKEDVLSLKEDTVRPLVDEHDAIDLIDPIERIRMRLKALPY